MEGSLSQTLCQPLPSIRGLDEEETQGAPGAVQRQGSTAGVVSAHKRCASRNIVPLTKSVSLITSQSLSGSRGTPPSPVDQPLADLEMCLEGACPFESDIT